MHIVFAASECVPFAKTGGLAEVIGALPREVVKLGHKTTVYLPRYRQVAHYSPKRKVAIASITVPFRSYNRFVTVLDGGLLEGVQYYFLDCPEMFDREELYGTAQGNYGDNAERFGLYCRAVLEASKQIGVPDLFHAHDWQASLLPVLLRTVYSSDSALRKVGTLLTLHNVAFQGTFPAETMEQLLLPWSLFTMDKLEHYGAVDLLKGGIAFADAITTVSRKYAEEIQTAELGVGLEGLLQRRSPDLHGVLNGADYAEWNPEHDRHIAAHYSRDRLEGKRDCRKDLLHAFAFEQVGESTPVVGIVSHFSTQKGFDLIAQILEELVKEDMVLCVLGTGEPYYEGGLRKTEERYPGKVRVKVIRDETMAHKIMAGADIYLMPSRYEPSGLNQMRALRYGAVPVVSATGGLDDTVAEWDPAAKSGTGFKVRPRDAAALLDGLRRAFAAFGRKDSWPQLMRNGMAEDFGWSKPANAYCELYREVVRRRS